MDPVAKTAFITSQAACAQIEAIAMQEQNRVDEASGRERTYKPHDFTALIDRYVIGHNAVISFLRE